MKYLVTILFITYFASCVTAQSPKGQASPSSPGYSKIGYQQVDSGFIYPKRDTNWLPAYPGTTVLWQHAGVDSVLWMWNGKWAKVNDGINSNTTLAALRLKTNLTEGKIYSISDWGGGQWYVDKSDVTSVDDTVLCIVTTNGIRVKRLYDGMSISIKWCGQNVGYDYDNHTTADETKDDIAALELATRFVEYGGYNRGHKGSRLYFPQGAYNVSRTWRPPSYCLVEGVNSSVYIFAMNQAGRTFTGDFIMDTNKPGWEEFQIRNFRLHCRNNSIPRYSAGDGGSGQLIPSLLNGIVPTSPIATDYKRKLAAYGDGILGGIGGLRVGACRNSIVENITTEACNGIAGVAVMVTDPNGNDVENLTLRNIYTIHSTGLRIIPTTRGAGSTYNATYGYNTGGYRGNITDMQIENSEITTRDYDAGENISEIWPIPFKVQPEPGSNATAFGIKGTRFICASKNNTLFQLDGGYGQLGSITGCSFDRISVEMQGLGNDGFVASGVTHVPAYSFVNSVRNVEFKNTGETIVPGDGVFIANNCRNITFDHMLFKNKSESDGVNNKFIRIDGTCRDIYFGPGIDFQAAIEEDYDRSIYARAAGNFFNDKIIDSGYNTVMETPLVKTKFTMLNAVPDFLATDTTTTGMKWGWNGDGSVGDGRSDTAIHCTTNGSGNLVIDFPPDYGGKTFFTVNLKLDDAMTQRSGIVIKYRFLQRDAGFAFQLYGNRPDIYDVPSEWHWFSVAIPKKPVAGNYNTTNPFMSFTAYRQDNPRLGHTIIEVEKVVVGLDAIPYYPNMLPTPYFGKQYLSSFYPANLYLDSTSGLVGAGNTYRPMKIDNTVIPSKLSATSTLDFPSTAAGTSSELTVTLTGAVVGDNVLITKADGTAIANTLLSGRASATNQITLKFNNYSSGTIDPPSASYNIKLLK